MSSMMSLMMQRSSACRIVSKYLKTIYTREDQGCKFSGLLLALFLEYGIMSLICGC